MIVFSPLTLDDLAEVTAAYAAILNDWDELGDWLLEGFNDPNYVGVKAIFDGQIVGAFSARPGIEFTGEGHADLIEELTDFAAGGSMFTVDMFLVLPNFRSHGIGAALTDELKRMLCEHGCDHLIIEAWRKPGTEKPEAANIIYYLGETTYRKTMLNFYADLEALGIICPECGARCVCGADIYVLNVRAPIPPKGGH